MDSLLLLKAVMMGLVEGFTEFLPISSTGHLILAGSLLGFTGETAKLFEIVIQSGAILAICWEYRSKLSMVISGWRRDVKARKFLMNLAIAFFPAAVLGLIFGKKIKQVLFSPIPVALAFIVGGLLILWLEWRNKTHPAAIRIHSVDDMSFIDAFKVGCVQALALIPGTSRSGASIIGGMWFGLSRRAATEFSFFLAIPTLFAATLYSCYKERALFTAADLPLFGVGMLAAFISAFICVRWLLRYIASHDFTIFAWYRIVFGLLVLASAYGGWVTWAD